MKYNYLFIPLILTIVTYSLLLLVALMFVSVKTKNFSNLGGIHQKNVYKDYAIKQTFESRFNNLDTIYIRIKNTNLSNIDPVTFSLFNSDQNLLRRIDISGRNIGGDEWVKFQFEPIIDSQGKNITFELQSPSTKDNSLIVFHDDRGMLSFKSYSRGSITDGIWLNLQDFYYRFSLDLGFIISYVLIFVIGCIWLFYNLRLDHANKY